MCAPQRSRLVRIEASTQQRDTILPRVGLHSEHGTSGSEDRRLTERKSRQGNSRPSDHNPRGNGLARFYSRVDRSVEDQMNAQSRDAWKDVFASSGAGSRPQPAVSSRREQREAGA